MQLTILMYMRISFVMAAAAVVMSAGFLSSCGGSAVTDEVGVDLVRFPNGARFNVERVSRTEDLRRGLMFREALGADRGMLFVHPREGSWKYWMFNTKIPLDIIWISRNHQVTEISANTPPCPSATAADCPNYGGHEPSVFVLEVNAGQAAKNGLKVGDMLDFY